MEIQGNTQEDYGYEPNLSLIHIYSKEVCQILRSPSIYAVSQDGRLVHTDEVIQTNEQEIHFIIQFKKGDKICLGGQEAVIPCSNRLIITKITVNEFVPFSRPYFEWIERNGMDISSNVLSLSLIHICLEMYGVSRT